MSSCFEELGEPNTKQSSDQETGDFTSTQYDIVRKVEGRNWKEMDIQNKDY